MLDVGSRYCTYLYVCCMYNEIQIQFYAKNSRLLVVPFVIVF